MMKCRPEPRRYHYVDPLDIFYGLDPNDIASAINMLERVRDEFKSAGAEVIVLDVPAAERLKAGV